MSPPPPPFFPQYRTPCNRNIEYCPTLLLTDKMAASCVTKLTTFCNKTCSKRPLQAIYQPVLYNRSSYGVNRPTQIANLGNGLHQKCALSGSSGFHTLCRNSVSKLQTRSRTLTFVPLRRASSSSGGGGGNQNQEPPKLTALIPIRNPYKILRDRMYSFLIRVYFDPDFYLDDFAAGARQVCNVCLFVLIYKLRLANKQ